MGYWILYLVLSSGDVVIVKDAYDWPNNFKYETKEECVHMANKMIKAGMDSWCEGITAI